MALAGTSSLVPALDQIWYQVRCQIWVSKVDTRSDTRSGTRFGSFKNHVPNHIWRCLFCIRRKDLARAGTTESFAWPGLGLAWPALAWPGLAGLARLGWPDLGWPGRPGLGWLSLAWPAWPWPGLAWPWPGQNFPWYLTCDMITK